MSQKVVDIGRVVVIGWAKVLTPKRERQYQVVLQDIVEAEPQLRPLGLQRQ